MDRQNTHEKQFRTHEITTRKSFGPTKYPRENFWTHEIPRRRGKHFWTREKYPREKISDTQNTREGTMALDPQWNVTHEI